MADDDAKVAKRKARAAARAEEAKKAEKIAKRKERMKAKKKNVNAVELSPEEKEAIRKERKAKSAARAAMKAGILIPVASPHGAHEDRGPGVDGASQPPPPPPPPPEATSGQASGGSPSSVSPKSRRTSKLERIERRYSATRHGIGEAADEAWSQGQAFKTPEQKRVYSKAEFDDDGNAIVESLKVGMLVNAKLIGMEKPHPCVITRIAVEFRSVAIMFEDGEREEDVPCKFITELKELEKRRVRRSLEKRRKLAEEESAALSLTEPKQAADSNPVADVDFFSYLFGLHDQDFYADDEVAADESESDPEASPVKFVGTHKEMKKTKSGATFFPRWLAEKFEQSEITISDGVILHRRMTEKRMVFEVENHRAQYLRFKIRFKGSKNLKLDTGGLKRTTIIDPVSIKEVAYLLVIDLAKPWSLKTKYEWDEGVDGKKDFPATPSLCGGSRGSEKDGAGDGMCLLL